MSWKRALKADARLAAKNAVKIRAALRQSVNFSSIAGAYEQTAPQKTGNLAQTRARARAWAIMNVRVNQEILRDVLIRTWAEGYVLGVLAAEEQVELARRRQKAPQTTINWDTWKPGDAVAALLVRPPSAFRRILERFGLTLKGFSDTTLDDIGNALGESIELGLSQKQTAKRIEQHVASPSRAMMIAVTEQARAISAATISRYKEMGVEKNEWLASDPCDICAENDGQVVRVGENFASGDDQPPAHPNCRCTLLPVIPGMEEANIDNVRLSDTDTEEIETINSTQQNAKTIKQYQQASYVNNNNDADFYKHYDVSRVRSYYGLDKNGDIDWNSAVRGNENLFLKNLLKDQGFLNAPRVLSKSEFDKLANQGNPVIYRGIAADNTKQLNNYVDDLLHSSNPFIGKGMFGDGIYFANKLEIAESFAKENALGTKTFATGKVVKAIVDPQAKIIDRDDLVKEMRASFDSPRYAEISAKYPQDFLGDYGVFAASRGYDGIRIRNPKISWQPDAKPIDADYIVIFNRSALIMEENK